MNTDHIQLLQYFTAQLNERNEAAIVPLFSPHFVWYDIPPGLPNGVDAWRQNMSATWMAFPDYHTTIEVAVAEGTKVALVAYIQGTQLGKLLDLPPTGKRIAVRMATFYEIHDNRIIGLWGIADTMGMLRQLQTQK